MSKFNTSSTHPIIPNSNDYMYTKKYVSIHSEDRDILKYPNPAEFEIELPQDYLNVQSIKLIDWSFPSNYDVFSDENINLTMTFQITEPYNPKALGVVDPYQELVYIALKEHIGKNFFATIETGFYQPDQMARELTTQYNQDVTKYLYNYFINGGPAFEYAVEHFQPYDQFVIVYNQINQRLWFGNKSSRFLLTNDSPFYLERKLQTQALCIRQNNLPEATKWGLPDYLGFTRCSTNSYHPTDYNVLPFTGLYVYSDHTTIVLPQFAYDTDNSNKGFWLIPDLPKASVYFLRAPERFNFFGPSYIYLDINNLNCIDETSPYNISNFTLTTNITNGIVNSAFSKIPVNTTTTITQIYDNNNICYKWFNPPAERIRRLRIRFRYHNGQLVKFGNFDYTFTLEFNLLTPQYNTKVNLLPYQF